MDIKGEVLLQLLTKASKKRDQNDFRAKFFLCL